MQAMWKTKSGRHGILRLLCGVVDGGLEARGHARDGVATGAVAGEGAARGSGIGAETRGKTAGAREIAQA